MAGVSDEPDLPLDYIEVSRWTLFVEWLSDNIYKIGKYTLFTFLAILAIIVAILVYKLVQGYYEKDPEKKLKKKSKDKALIFSESGVRGELTKRQKTTTARQ